MEKIINSKENQDADVIVRSENIKESKSIWKSLLSGNKLSIKTLLVIIAVGIWINILQNTGIIPSVAKHVYVIGGNIDADVAGVVDIQNTVDVDVQNQVSVDIQRVLGYPIGCHRSYTIDGREYQAIDVYKSNW